MEAPDLVYFVRYCCNHPALSKRRPHSHLHILMERMYIERLRWLRCSMADNVHSLPILLCPCILTHVHAVLSSRSNKLVLALSCVYRLACRVLGDSICVL